MVNGLANMDLYTTTNKFGGYSPSLTYQGAYTDPITGAVDYQGFDTSQAFSDPSTKYSTNLDITTRDGNSLGFNMPTMKAIGTGLQGLGGLAKAYLGYKQYGLAKDAFNFQKGLANRNLATQGSLINKEMTERKERELAGSGLADPEKQRILADVKKNYVDTTPI